MHTVVIMDSKVSKWIDEYNPLFEPFILNGAVSWCNWNEQAYTLDKALPDLKKILKYKEDWRAVFVIKPDNINKKNPFDYNADDAMDVPVIRISQMLDNVYEIDDKKEDLDIPKPREIILISPRIVNGEYDANKVFNNKNDISESSKFAINNGYSSICRFLVYDIVNESHINFKIGLVGFVSSIISIALNVFPVSLIQAYRLYSVKTDYSKEEFCKMCSKFYTKLEKNREILLNMYEKNTDKQSKQAKEIAFINEQELVNVDKIDIVFENVDYNSVKANKKGFGLAKDCPIWDNTFWKAETTRVMKDIDKMVVQPKKMVDEAIDFAKEQQVINQIPILNKYQIENLDEEAEKKCVDLYSQDSFNKNEFNHFKKLLKTYERFIFQQLRYRMTRKTTIIIGSIVLLLFIGCFITSLVDIVNNYWDFDVLLIPGMLIVILATLMINYLYYLKRNIIKGVKVYNNKIVDVLKHFVQSYANIGKILTFAGSYSKTRKVLQFQSDAQELVRYRKAMKIHLMGLDERINLCGDWIEPFNAELIKRNIQLEEGLEIDVAPHKSNIYYPDVKKENKELILKPTLDKIYQPYDYIKEIVILREEVYDC